MKNTLLFLFFLTLSTITNAQQVVANSPALVKKIEVTGSAELEVVPDEIFIGITLQEYYNKMREKINIDVISKNLIASCEKAGITKDRIEVQNISGFDQTNWWYRKRKKEQPDLMQSTTYIVKFAAPGDVDKLLNLIDDNATQNVYTVRTSNTKEKEYRKQLKIQALQNAKAKASYLLEGIGAKAGEVLYVREVETNIQPYPMFERAAMANTMMAEAPTANEGLNFRKIKYRYDIEAHFSIE